MGVYLYPNNTETPLKEAYIGIPNPTSIVLDKSFISLTTIGQTEQLTATIEPTISDHSVTWSSDDTSVATVSTTGLVTCVTPGTCTITATTVNGLTATCGVTDQQGWQPDPTRTIFYYDFEDSNNRLADSSGNNNTAISGYNVTYTQVGGQYVAELTSNLGGIQITPTLGSSIGTGDFAISFWIYLMQPGSGSYPLLFGIYLNNSPYRGPNIFFDPLNVNGHGDVIFYRMRGGGSSYEHAGNTTASTLYNGWHHIVMTRNSGVVSCYLDNILDTSWSNDSVSFPTSNADGYIISRGDFGFQSSPSGAKGDKYIFEKVGWGSQDVADYFNTTKTIYGIS